MTSRLQPPTLLVYGAGSNQLPVLEAGRRRGWRIVAIDRDPKAPGIPLANRFICTSMRDHDAIAAAVAAETLCGVVARVTDPVALDSSRRIADGHGLAGPSPALVAAATSKRALADLCRIAGLATPRRFGPDASIAFTASRAVRAVCVRPDVTVRGKAAIRRVASPGELAAARADAAAASANGEIDVAEWIEGADVSVLAELDRGRARRIALWDEWVALRPDGGIAGIGAGMPSIAEGDPRVVDASLAALAAACPESRCLATVSLRIDRAGAAWLIEIHLGVGGDALADLLLPAALPGFDAFDSLVAITAGLAWTPPSAPPRPRGLLRAGSGWRLVAAPDPRALRAAVRATIPRDWTLPEALREGSSRLG